MKYFLYALGFILLFRIIGAAIFGLDFVDPPLVYKIGCAVAGAGVALAIERRADGKRFVEDFMHKINHVECVWCLEEVKKGARVCKHCGKDPSG